MFLSLVIACAFTMMLRLALLSWWLFCFVKGGLLRRCKRSINRFALLLLIHRLVIIIFSRLNLLILNLHPRRQQHSQDFLSPTLLQQPHSRSPQSPAHTSTTLSSWNGNTPLLFQQSKKSHQFFIPNFILVGFD